MADYMKNNDVSLEWDAIIDDDEQEFILLPAGDYDFRVTAAERGFFDKHDESNDGKRVLVTMQVETGKGIAICKTLFGLSEKNTWRISAFFRSIGMKKRGEPFRMDWEGSVGKTGRAYFKPRTFNDKFGEERQANNIARFYDKEPEQPKVVNNVTPTDDEDLPFD